MSIISDEEKIQKAQEIYYRRNGINYRGEKNKQSSSPRHTFRNIIMIMLIIIVAYGYQNKEKLQSAEFQEEIKSFLNTKINIKDIFSTQIKENKSQETVSPENKQEIPEAIQEYETANPEAKVIWPHIGEITSNFGERNSEDSRVSNNHTGIDIAGNQGDKIISAISGKVVTVSEEGNLRKTHKNRK